MSANTDTALIWGSGAIGSILGGALLDAGRRVVFVDVDEAHLDRIRAGDLVVEGASGRRVYGAPAFTPETLSGQFSQVFLSVRLNANREAIPALRAHLAEGAVTVSCQNGFGAWDVAEAFGSSATVAASFFLPANFQGPGRVVYGSRADISLGTVGPGGEKAFNRAYEWLGPIDADVHKAEDIESVIWSKLTYGALLAAAALDDGLIAEFLAAPRLRPLVLGLVREMTSLASATGHPAQDLDWFRPNEVAQVESARSDASLEATLARLRKSSKPVSGYWTQIVTHGRKTEIELMFGRVLQAAEKAGRDVPILRTLLELVGDMEAGKRSCSPELLDILLKTAMRRPSGSQI